MNRTWNRTLAVAALAAAALAAQPGAALAAGEAERHEKIRLIWNAEGESDRLILEDLELEPGESRTFTTESGRVATVTRDEEGEGLTVEVDGKTIRVGGPGELEDLPGHRVFVRRLGHPAEGEPETVVLGEGEPGERRVLRKIVVEDGGEAKSFVVSGDDPDVVVLRGAPGEHGFAFSTGGLPPRLPTEHLLERIEKSEKFLALDDATREIVREVVRDAAPKWKLRSAVPGDGGQDGVQVIVEREVEEDPAD